jgi:hypothetical protein
MNRQRRGNESGARQSGNATKHAGGARGQKKNKKRTEEEQKQEKDGRRIKQRRKNKDQCTGTKTEQSRGTDAGDNDRA